ncbi:hypothetical protein AB6A40_001158 [Gnathostoma spinigerum]|uniref:Uncharacterized protein n=1 Tax=Gnathostoma spinigerum TaxID=75299 RepID=A0ABD6EAS3_9BILA
MTAVSGTLNLDAHFRANLHFQYAHARRNCETRISPYGLFRCFVFIVHFCLLWIVKSDMGREGTQGTPDQMITESIKRLIKAPSTIIPPSIGSRNFRNRSKSVEHREHHKRSSTTDDDRCGRLLEWIPAERLEGSQ